MAQLQKAVLLVAKQGAIEVGTRPIPVPQGKQALVKVTAAAVNPIDWKIVDYGLFLNDFPAVLGIEAAGIIESVGSEVANFKKGDKVFFQGRYTPQDEATFQEYTLVDTEIISKIPNNINDNQAATIPVGAMTSVVALFQKSGITFPENGPTANGKSVLIVGGSSSVGQAAIQLARIAGFSPIVTTASAQHTEFLKSLGATHVFNRDVGVETIQKAFPTPVALALDAIAIPNTQLFAFKVLTTPAPPSGAHLALALPIDPAVEAANANGKVTVNAIYGSPHTYKDFGVLLYRTIGKWIEEGKYVPNHVHLVEGGLAAVPEALDLSRKGVSGVKIVIRPQE